MDMICVDITDIPEARIVGRLDLAHPGDLNGVVADFLDARERPGDADHRDDRHRGVLERVAHHDEPVAARLLFKAPSLPRSAAIRAATRR